jgi:tetratricopeptide (TPR) repeat protein
MVVGTTHDTTRLRLFKQSGDLHAKCCNWEIAIENYVEAVTLAQKLDENFILIDCCIGISQCYWYRGMLEDAQQAAQLGLEYARASNYQRGIAYGLREVGIIENIRAQPYIAAQHFQESNEIATVIPDVYLVAKNLQSLGNTASNMFQYDKALEYYGQSLTIINPFADKEFIAGIYLNLAWVAIQQENYDDAHKWIDEGFRIKRMIGDRKGMALAYNLQARIALRQNQDVWVYISEAITIARSISATHNLLNSLLIAAYEMYHNNRLVEAIRYAVTVSTHQAASTEIKREAHDLLSSIAQEMGSSITATLIQRVKQIPLNEVIDNLMQLSTT